MEGACLDLMSMASTWLRGMGVWNQLNERKGCDPATLEEGGMAQPQPGLLDERGHGSALLEKGGVPSPNPAMQSERGKSWLQSGHVKGGSWPGSYLSHRTRDFGSREG